MPPQPKPVPTSKTGKTVFTANAPANQGDIVVSDNGWWVCIFQHVTGNGPTPDGLKPGQSNQNWHWSAGPS